MTRFARLLTVAAMCLSSVGTANAVVTQLFAAPVKVTTIAPRNKGFTGGVVAQYIIIGFNASTTYCGGAATNAAAVPKANPNTADGGENPAYRDYVNTFMMAFALDRDVYVFVDGCIDGAPRIVGANMI